MTDEHPITPSLEVVNNWVDMLSSRSDYAVFTTAVQWGADLELEACAEWLGPLGIKGGDTLRRVRRPKPPSLKEKALAVLDDCSDRLDGAHENIIRLALEALPQ